MCMYCHVLATSMPLFQDFPFPCISIMLNSCQSQKSTDPLFSIVDGEIKNPCLPKLIFCNVEMQIPDIQPSSPPWIGPYKPSRSTSCSCSWLNQILFSFWWLDHHRLTKERLTRECYCHGNWHCIIKFNISEEKAILGPEYYQGKECKEWSHWRQYSLKSISNQDFKPSMAGPSPQNRKYVCVYQANSLNHLITRYASNQTFITRWLS